MAKNESGMSRREARKKLKLQAAVDKATAAIPSNVNTDESQEANTSTTSAPIQNDKPKRKRKTVDDLSKEGIARAVAEADKRAGISEKLKEVSSATLDAQRPKDIFEDAPPAPEKRMQTTISVDPVTGRQTKTTTEEGGAPGSAITSVMNTSPNTAVTTSDKIYDDVTKDPNTTFEQTVAAGEVAAKVDEAKEEAEAEADAAIGQQMEKVQQDLEGQGEGTEGGGGAPNAQSNFMQSGIGAGAQGQRPTYEATTSTDKVGKDVAKLDQMDKGYDEYIPQAVVEKLGVQDYYPNIGRNIAVGNWSGSVLGSQTIYAGAGAIMPMGLYDARKRALDEAAKQKQAKIDKMLEMPDTSPQYQVAYQDYGFDFINSELERFGSYDAMTRDPEFRKNMARIKNIGKEISYVDGVADKYLKDLNDGKWVPKDVVENLYKFKSGLIEDLPDILSGNKSASDYVNFFKSYENGISWIDQQAKDGLFSKERMDEAPISMNTGEIQKDQEGFEKFRSELIKSLNGDGSIDNDTYVTGLKRYFDLSRVEPLIDSWIQGNNADANTKEAMMQHLIALIPKQTVLDYTSMSNDQRERVADQMENARFYAGLAERKKERETYYQRLNADFNASVNGKTLDQHIAYANSQKWTPEQKRSYLIRVGKDFNAGTPIYDPYTGAIAFTRAPSKQMRDNPQVFSSDGSLGIEVWDGNKWTKRSMTPNQIRGLKEKDVKGGKYRFPNGGGKITYNDIKDLKSTQNLALKVTSLGAVRTQYKDGKWVTITDKNMGDFREGAKTSNAERLQGSLVIPTTDKDGNVTYKATKWNGFVARDFGTNQGQSTLDSQFGSTGENLKGIYESNSSSSSSYGGSQ